MNYFDYITECNLDAKKLDEIDSNLHTLIRTLNTLPDIFTFYSCGGHDDNLDYQLPKGEWVISIEIMRTSPDFSSPPSRTGWISLGKLLLSVFNYNVLFDYQLPTTKVVGLPFHLSDPS